jgi:nitroreductase/NAD-dependent dihydropyrimidine dehydrogenase PreA subunit
MENTISVDKERCRKCGACADVCPLNIIVRREGGHPGPVVWAKKVCIDCGHCVAVCPEAALDQRSMSADQCASVIPAEEIPSSSLERYFRSRRSVRAYRNGTVDKGVLEKIIDTARYAPTGHNSQTVNWRIVHDRRRVELYRDLVLGWMREVRDSDPKTAKRLQLKGIIAGCEAGKDIIMRNAPHLVIAHSPADDRMGDSSCRIAMSHFELLAPAFGVGTCWAGFLDIAVSSSARIADALELPEGHVSRCSMLVGHPEHKYRRVPLRAPSRISWL